MANLIGLLSGKKTYLLMIAFCVLVLFGQVPEDGVQMPDSKQLQAVVLAAGLAALRAGVAKATAEIARATKAKE